MRIKLKTPPTSYPVTLEEIKNFLRIDSLDSDCASTSDDVYLTSLIKAATEYCESYQNIAYLTQTWVIYMETLPCRLTLPKGNIQSIDGVTYKTKAGVETSYTGYYYNIDTGKMYFEDSISDELYPVEPIKIEYTCGYVSADELPERVIQAVKFLVSHWYENRVPIDETRTEAKEIVFTLSALLNMDKRVIL